MAPATRAPAKSGRSRSQLDDTLDGVQSLPFDAPSGAGQPPTVKLPIGSLDGVECALREWAWINATETAINARADKRVAAERQAAAEKMQLLIGAEHVPFADRRKALIAAIEEFVTPNREALIEEGKKSRELNHGTIGFRQRKATLAAVEGGEPAGNAKILDGIIRFCLAALEKFTLFSAGCIHFVTIQCKFDRTAILKAAQAKQVTAAELRRVGFTVRPAEDEFFAEPKALAVSSPETVDA